MSTKDEKDWLRAILEGRVKPGDAEWERIWQDENFTGVRRVLREVGMRKKDELVADREKMWRVVKQYRGEGRNRRRVAAWRWVAAVMLPLLLGGILWINLREKKDLLVAEVMLEIEAGTPRAVLLMEQGERIDLSLLAGDTILNKGDVRIRLDSSKSVTYERVTGTPAKIEYNTIIVPRKGEYQLILADGSKVYLNSESRLRFPTRFEGKERRVYLEGEGFFQVAKDAAKPFIVHCEKYAVRVLGTTFNISAYRNDEVSMTTLVEGRVNIECGNTVVALTPGLMAAVADSKVTTREVNVESYISWTRDQFSFSEERLEDLLKKISRWYDVEIFFSNESVKKVRFTGAIVKFKPLDDLVRMIESTSQVRFSVKGKTIVISE